MDPQRRLSVLAFVLVLALVLGWWWQRPAPHEPAKPAPPPALKALPDIIVRALSTPTMKTVGAPTVADPNSELERILHEEDVCGLIRFLDKVKPLPIKELSSFLISNKNLRPHDPAEERDFETLFKGLVNGSDIPNQGAEMLKFYNALMFGDLLDGVVSPQIDRQEAVLLLRDLEAEDPQNGAFPFFLASILDKQGRPEAEVKDQVRQALVAPDFDTYVTDIGQNLWEKGLQNPMSLVLARLLISDVPLPNYNTAYLTTLNQVVANPDLAGPAISFGEKLMANGIEFGSSRDEWVYWLAIEHNLGRLLVGKAWPLAHPDGSKPDPKYTKTYKEFLRPLSVPDSLYPQSELFQKIARSADGVCPKAELQKIFARKLHEFEEFSASPAKDKL